MSGKNEDSKLSADKVLKPLKFPMEATSRTRGNVIKGAIIASLTGALVYYKFFSPTRSTETPAAFASTAIADDQESKQNAMPLADPTPSIKK